MGCHDMVRILTPSYALDSPTVCRKVAAAGELMGVDAGVECRNSMDSPTVWRMEKGGCCRGVHGYEDRRGVPRQDSNLEAFLRLGLPNSV